MDETDPDLHLVRALQGGDQTALGTIMERHQDGVFRFVTRHVPNEADALELTTDTFARAYFGIGRFQPTARFRTWLYHIALNLCRDHARSRAQRNARQTVSADAADPLGESLAHRLAAPAARGPDLQAERREELAGLEAALAQLPPDLREPLVLTALEGFSQAEAASMLGMTQKAVGMRVYRARKLLVEYMTKAGF